jgi:phage shock protein PspC (stress-responsive transcriptional regulator)
MVRGVCAGLAHYLDVPVKLVRVVTVLSIFFGLAFITLVAYIILSFVLDPMPEGELASENAPTTNDFSMRWMPNWPPVRSACAKWNAMSRLIPLLRSRFRQL